MTRTICWLNNIEEREPEEVLYVGRERIAPIGIKVYNPAFDVTPAKYITGFITKQGIWKRPHAKAR